MPTDLDSLKTLAEFQQELLARLAAAHVALSQASQGPRAAALQALRDFSGYTALPNDHLREVAGDAITDFLLQNIAETQAALRTLERQLQEATQLAPPAMHLLADSSSPRPHLLRALSSLATLQASHQRQHRPGVAGPPQSQLALDSDKLDQVVKLIGELLVPLQTAGQPSPEPPKRSGGRRQRPATTPPAS